MRTKRIAAAVVIWTAMLVGCSKSRDQQVSEPNNSQSDARTDVGNPASLPKSTSPTSTPRLPSERLAAAMAADLGLQIHLWAESADQAPVSVVSATDSMGLRIASQVVNATLTPTPEDASRSLPKDPAERARLVDSTVSKWVSQVREQLKGAPYLDVHFAIGNSLGAIRNSLAVKYNVGQDRQALAATDNFIQANVNVVDAVLKIPDVELTAAQREMWANLKRDLESRQLTPQQILALRSRLQDWLDQFVATIRSSAK